MPDGPSLTSKILAVLNPYLCNDIYYGNYSSVTAGFQYVNSILTACAYFPATHELDLPRGRFLEHRQANPEFSANIKRGGVTFKKY